MRAGRSALALLSILLVSTASARASTGPGSLPCAEIPGHNDRCPAWMAVYDHPTGGGDVLGDDHATAVALSPDGSRLFVVGTSTDRDTGKDIAVVAVDAATGTQLWVARHHAPSDGGEVPMDIAVAPDGARVFVAGVEDFVLAGPDGPGDGRFVTLAYDASTGERLWAATLEGSGPGSSVAFAVEPAPDGSRVYVSGPRAGPDGSLELSTIAYEAGTGEEAWRASRPGVGAEGLDALRTELAVSPDGSRVYVAGSEGLTPVSRPADYLVVAYEVGDPRRLGDQVWAVGHDAGGQGVVRDLAVSPDGRSLFLAGKSEYHGVTLGFDAETGDSRWEARIVGNGLSGLAVAPSGDRVYVTGSDIWLAVGFQGYPPDVEPIFQTGGVLTAAYDASHGTELWIRRFDPPDLGFEEARGVGISPDGQTVYVAALASRGGVVSGGGCSVESLLQCRLGADSVGMVTLAYEAGSGEQSWVARFDDAPVTPVAAPAGMAVGTDRVFVAGDLGRPAGSSFPAQTANLSDFVMLAYDTR